MDSVRPLSRFDRICGSCLLTYLPFSPDLVSEAPVSDVMRFVFTSVLATQVCIVSDSFQVRRCLECA